MSDATPGTDTAEATPDAVLGTRGSSNRAEAVQAFVERFLTRVGAGVTVGMVDAEVDPRPCLDVALADAHVEFGDLGIADQTRFVFRPGPTAPQTHLVTPASAAFERMLGELRGHGHTTQLLLAAQHSERDALPDVEEPDHLDGPPEVRGFVGVDVEIVVRVTFVAEERHESLVVVHAPVHGTATVVDESVVRAASAAGQLDTAGFEPTPEAVEVGLQKALVVARDWAHEAAEPRQQLILEHLTRELQRLTHYYGELMAEHETDDEIREQLAADLDRRVSEEVQKHKLEIEFEPLACAIIGRPVVTFTYRDGDDDRWIYVYDRVSGDVWHETQTG